jgi:hypothetical protein
MQRMSHREAAEIDPARGTYTLTDVKMRVVQTPHNRLAVSNRLIVSRRMVLTQAGSKAADATGAVIRDSPLAHGSRHVV